MRNVYSVLAIILFMCMLLIPLLAMETDGENKSILPPVTEEKEDVFRVLCGEEVATLSAEEYITGVVAAEMPVLYETEALKAQAVAAYTYAARRRATAEGEYDITNDHTKDQSYINEAAQREKWGENYEEYSKKIKSAVTAVAGKKLVYKDELCLSVYHAISSGKTESAENFWDKEYPYLCSVESVYDILSPDYKTEKTVTQDEIKTAFSDVTFTEDPQEWFSDTVKTQVGTVTEITFCNTKIKGTVFREKLSLRSQNFDIEFIDGVFKITVRGYGHGVGMSQYGANCMAKQGAKYDEILLAYYKGAKIE